MVKIPIYLMGVINHGRGTKAFVVPGHFKQGTNVVLWVLIRTLQDMTEHLTGYICSSFPSNAVFVNIFNFGANFGDEFGTKFGDKFGAEFGIEFVAEFEVFTYVLQ